MGFYYPIVILLFVLLTKLGDSRLTPELLEKTAFAPSESPESTNWAVLVAGSRGFHNYRHQADICHAYQILKRGKIKEENIVVFMYDDIANHTENPKKGTIVNSPNGEDVYGGVPKDYTGRNLTTNNLLAAILGNKAAISGGSGKVVNSWPNDHIFIYYSDHGSPGFLNMPNDDDLTAKHFIDTLEKKYLSRTYKSMVIYVEACEGGSIFEGLLKEEWNIYVATASNPAENSWATYCPPDSDSVSPIEYDTCLADLFSAAWMEDSEKHNTENETLIEQYRRVKSRTLNGGNHGSHAMQYGNGDLSTDHLSLYLGPSPSTNHKWAIDNDNNNPLSSPTTVDQHEADILYLKRKVVRAPKGSKKRKEAQEELDAALSHREHIHNIFQDIVSSLSGDQNGYNDTRSAGQPIVDDWNCYSALVETYKTYCGTLSTYGKKHLRVFANLCNAGVHQSQVAKAASQVCGNKYN